MGSNLSTHVICNSNSMGSNSLFWSPPALHTHVVHGYTCRQNTYTWANKLFSNGRQFKFVANITRYQAGIRFWARKTHDSFTWERTHRGGWDGSAGRGTHKQDLSLFIRLQSWEPTEGWGWSWALWSRSLTSTGVSAEICTHSDARARAHTRMHKHMHTHRSHFLSDL